MIGLTGGVAAGKSEALAAFARLGAETIASDAVVHELLGSSEVADLLTERWGDEVVHDGVVDRGRVGAIVFERPQELAWLESVLHPRVGARIASWIQDLPKGARLAVIEVPLLFETGMEGLFDTVVAVVAPDDIRNARMSDRGVGAAAEESGRQLSQSEKAARSAHVVVNDGSVDALEEQLRSLLPDLTAVGARG